MKLKLLAYLRGVFSVLFPPTNKANYTTVTLSSQNVTRTKLDTKPLSQELESWFQETPGRPSLRFAVSNPQVSLPGVPRSALKPTVS
ncbi:UNVERIFIED_CONTAM: hypothetical protein FKN15_073804 [Acipenser sinensis]